ncbi:MAG: hypothetical protein PS018_27870 [bacterium]|nr:hypothetical protein [bacterium]
MPGLVPGIHVFVTTSKEGVDGRVKPGHDGQNLYTFGRLHLPIALIPRRHADTVPRAKRPPREIDSADGCPA